MNKCVLCTIIALILQISSLTGCGSGIDVLDISTDAPTNMQVRTPIEVPDIEPDYSDFVMPEDTEELVLYEMADDGGFGGSLFPFKAALELFRKRYPEVDVRVETFGDYDEFEARLRTEIPAGRGPDMIYSFYSTLLPDIYKAMASGMLSDLGGFMAKDPDFRRSDYAEGVLDSGMLQERQYIIPTSYNMPILFTTREILAEEGISEESLSSWNGFFDAMTKYCKNHPGFSGFGERQRTNPNSGNTRYLWVHSGMRMIDYDSYTVSLDEERFRSMMDFCRLTYRDDYETAAETWSNYENGGLLLEREGLFVNRNDSVGLMFYDTAARLERAGEEPVILMMPDENDGVTAGIRNYCAIPVGAKNMLNGWRFIKCLLSVEVQSGMTIQEGFGMQTPLSNFMNAIPINKEAIRLNINREYETIYGKPLDEERLDTYCALMTSATCADLVPDILIQYYLLEMMPYVKGERSWDDCYKRFLNTLELYASE